MVGKIAAQLGFLTFGVCVLAGIAAGNAPETILIRALGAVAGVVFVGTLVGSACRAVVRDHLLRRKIQIDTEHHAAVRAAASQTAGESE